MLDTTECVELGDWQVVSDESVDDDWAFSVVKEIPKGLKYSKATSRKLFIGEKVLLVANPNGIPWIAEGRVSWEFNQEEFDNDEPVYGVNSFSWTGSSGGVIVTGKLFRL